MRPLAANSPRTRVKSGSLGKEEMKVTKTCNTMLIGANDAWRVPRVPPPAGF